MKLNNMHAPGSYIVKKSVDLLIANIRDYEDFKVVHNAVDDYIAMGYDMREFYDKLNFIQHYIFQENK